MLEAITKKCQGGTQVNLVQDIKVMNVLGPWQTKSRGNLMVLFSLSQTINLQEFFKWDKRELENIPDIRGLRYYIVKDLPKGEIGGVEFHKVRQELVFATKGAVKWKCEDLYGNQKNTILTSQNGIWLPHFILHTYEVLVEGTELAVVANTTFDPEDSQTHDTFSSSEFQKLQKISKK